MRVSNLATRLRRFAVARLGRVSQTGEQFPGLVRAFRLRCRRATHAVDQPALLKEMNRVWTCE